MAPKVPLKWKPQPRLSLNSRVASAHYLVASSKAAPKNFKMPSWSPFRNDSRSSWRFVTGLSPIRTNCSASDTMPRKSLSWEPWGRSCFHVLFRPLPLLVPAGLFRGRIGPLDLKLRSARFSPTAEEGDRADPGTVLISCIIGLAPAQSLMTKRSPRGGGRPRRSTASTPRCCSRLAAGRTPSGIF